jgi:hypothetical protein
MQRIRKTVAPGLFLAALAAFGVNYDESNVPDYTLPDPLVAADGDPVTDAAAWHGERRAEIVALFETQVYGRAPAPTPIRTAPLGEDTVVLDGKAIRRQLRIRLRDKPDAPAMDMLIYIPRTADKPVPAFLGLNFQGNHSIQPDPGIVLSQSWMPNKAQGVMEHRATEASRGAAMRRWPVSMIVDRGYALATMHYGDIDPDFDDGFQNGLHPHFAAPGQADPAPDDWGSVAAWAYGLSRGLDALVKDPDIDGKRVAVMGHSRLGKVSLWAGARDDRFALVISNNSGCGGAALSRRAFGETVARINASFPHWFCDNYSKYNDNEDACPVDQHMLIALMAPRPVYVASAEQDRWADPKGEFLSCRGADPVYRLLGTDGCAADAMPPIQQPITSRIGYHIRPGKHDVKEYDWTCYLNFADKHMK